jgi:thiol-disulfide isomerase/thioredoxin
VTDQQSRTPVKHRLARIAAAGGAGLIVGLAAIYGIVTLTGNARGAPECRAAVTLASKVAPFATGEVAAVNVAKSPLKVPDLSFKNAAGKQVRLDDFHGRTVLLNLWATWCVPCRREMPTLDALEAKMGSPAFQVVAVNIDTRNPNRPKTFLKQIGVKNLTFYADPSAKAFQDLKDIGRAFGMPTTMLIDPHGCEIGTIAGPADWASKDAVKLIKAALGKGPDRDQSAVTR